MKGGDRIFVISGERVSLVVLSMDDVYTISRWANDKRVTQYLNIFRGVFSVEYERKWLEKALMDTDNPTFGIWKNDEERLIGILSLRVDKDNNRALIGLYIGEVRYWNQGLGTEATILALDYAFNVLNVHKVWLGVFAFNKRALKSYIKAGFKEVGRLREHVRLSDNQYVDYIVMDILKNEFDMLHRSKIRELAKDRFRQL